MSDPLPFPSGEPRAERLYSMTQGSLSSPVIGLAQGERQ